MSGFIGRVLLDAVRTGSTPAGGRRLYRLSGSGLGSHGRLGRRGLHPDPLLRLRRVLETHLAGRGREHRVVPAEARARAREEGHSALPHDDRAGGNELAVADLDAEPLADRVAAVLRAGSSLLVGHRVYSSFFVARGLVAGFSGAFFGFASAAPDCVFARCAFGSALAGWALPAPLLGADLGAARPPVFAAPRVAGFASVLLAAPVPAVELRPAVVFAPALLVAAVFARRSASAASSAACRAAASCSRSRSVFAAASALRFSSAALLPFRRTSVIRRTVSSWRWPFLTRRRAFG